MGLSGVSRWGSDIGGYDTIQPDPHLTPELLKRWIGGRRRVGRDADQVLRVGDPDLPAPADLGR